MLSLEAHFAYCFSNADTILINIIGGGAQLQLVIFIGTAKPDIVYE